MAQENMNNFMQMAKDYAKAEKELEVQMWVYISIERTDEQGNRERVFSYDLPRELYEQKSWVIRWRVAKMQCQHPKDIVRAYTCFYDKRLGNDTKLTEDLRKLISAKAQASKVNRKIEEYIAWHKENDMFFDENTDIDLLKVREKLKIKELNVQEAEERLRIKIKQIENESNNN